MIAKHRRNLSLPLQPREAEERKNYVIQLSQSIYKKKYLDESIAH